jgi:hypothetical protein
MSEPLKWYDRNADNPPWINALAEVRQRLVLPARPAIIAVDQYAEAALGNREFFLNKPYGIGGGRTRDDIP